MLFIHQGPLQFAFCISKNWILLNGALLADRAGVELCSFFFFSLQLETIFTRVTELLSPVESGLVFLKGQRQDY